MRLPEVKYLLIVWTWGARRWRVLRRNKAKLEAIYTLKELPQPQVLFTLGLLNLKPAPSRVSM